MERKVGEVERLVGKLRLSQGFGVLFYKQPAGTEVKF